MFYEIAKNILSTVSILVLIGYLFTRIPFTRNYLFQEKHPFHHKLLLSLLFGFLGILSTILGTPIHGAIANTRTIGVMAGGIIGGPFVGIAAGTLAGMHRYLIDIGGFTAIACSVATMLSGLIGGLLSGYLKRSGHRWLQVGLWAMFAEALEMIVVLMLARPFPEAWALVKTIAGPMILVNGAGVVLFLAIIDLLFMEREKESAERIRSVLKIADLCLPHLRKGFYKNDEIGEVAKIIVAISGVSGALLTDDSEILSKAGKVSQAESLPMIVKKTLTGNALRTEEETSEFSSVPVSTIAICAPIQNQRGQAIGTLLIYLRTVKPIPQIEIEFAEGLAKLFSSQLAYSEAETQRRLRKKAELTALQSQINPHFLFNALSAIAMFCREKPERARELLFSLSNYFRKTLHSGKEMVPLSEEIDLIRSYVQLEQARFEERLMVEIDVSEKLDCVIPRLILQPIVENAIQHGAMQNQQTGRVWISAIQEDKHLIVKIKDNGPGIPNEILSQLKSDAMLDDSVGLRNVQKRLKSIYGKYYELQISNQNGTVITIKIPIEKGVNNEIFNYR